MGVVVKSHQKTGVHPTGRGKKKEEQQKYKEEGEVQQEGRVKGV